MKKRLSKLLLAVMLFNLLFSGLVRAEEAGGQTKLYFDGVEQTLTMPIETADGRSYVYGQDLAPLFDYSEGNGEIHITRKSVDVNITFGSSAVQVNGVARLFESPIYWTGGKNYIDMVLLSAVFGTNIATDVQNNRIDITLKTYAKASGTVYLPAGEVLAQDLPLYVITGATRTKITIPKGEPSCAYTLDVPVGDSIIGYQTIDTPKYLSGYYSMSGTVSNPDNAQSLDSSSQNLENIDLHLINAPYISGVVKLPDGVSAPEEGISIHLGGHYYSKIHDSYQYAETTETILKGQTQVPYKVYILDDTTPYIESWCYTIQSVRDDIYRTGYYRKDGTTSYQYGDSIGIKEGKAENIDLTLIKNRKFTGTIKLPGNKRAANDIRGSIYIRQYSQLYGEVTEIPEAEVSESEVAENAGLETVENSESSMAVAAPTPTTNPTSGGGSGGGNAAIPSTLMVLIPAGQNSGTYTVSLPEDSAMNSYTLGYELEKYGEYYYRGYYNQSGTSSQYGTGIPINQAPPVLTLLDMYTISGTVSKPVGFHADFQMTIRVTDHYRSSSAILNFTSIDTQLPYSVKLPADGGQYRVSYSVYGGSGSALLKQSGCYTKGGVIKDVYTSEETLFDLKGNVTGVDFTPLLAQETPEQAVTIDKIIDGYGRSYSLINNIDSANDDYYHKNQFTVNLLNWSGKTVSGKVEAKLYNQDGGVIQTAVNSFNMLSLSAYTAQMAFSADPPANTSYIEITVTDSNGLQLTEPFVSRRYAHTDDPNAIALDGYNAEMIDGVVMYRLRSIAELLGSSVSYDESTNSMTVKRNNRNIVFQINNSYAKVDGYSYGLSCPPVMINGQFMVEGESASNVLKVGSWWNSETLTRTFYIYWEANLLDINNLEDLSIGYSTVSGSVSSDTQSFTPDIVVSDGATWKLYRNESCTQEIIGGAMQLEFGKNAAYIKVTSKDDYDNIYELNVNRESIPIAALTINTPENLNQTSTTLSEVCFTVTPTPDEGIDTSKIQWYVNNELQDQTGLNFYYTPIGVGGYTVVAKAEDGLATDSSTKVILDTDDKAAITKAGFTADEKNAKTTKYSAKWNVDDAADITIKGFPTDISKFDTINFNIKIESIEEATMMLYFGSENSATDGMDYYSRAYEFKPGEWQTVTLKYSDLKPSRTPLGWNKISDFVLRTMGWTNNAAPGTVVYIENMYLSGSPDITSESRTITVTAAQNDATLSHLNFVPLNSENSFEFIGTYGESTDYDIVLSEEDTSPQIGYKTTNPNATAVVTNAAAIPGDTTIVVTSADGTATKTYTIHWTVYSDFYYTDDGSSITINGYHGADADIRIPCVINGKWVTSIGVHAFFGNRLETVVIPESVTAIGAKAFYYCVNLTSINLPKGLTALEYGLFAECHSLKVIDIPKSVNYISDSIFDNCTNLAAINVDRSNVNYSSAEGVLFDKEKTNIIKFPEGKEGNYIIPDTIETISDFCFSECEKLTSVFISNNVTMIGYAAFSGCKNLTSINIPRGVGIINNGVFSGCESLTSVDIPDGVTVIYYEAFYGCKSLTSITIPKSVNYIYSAFRDCDSLAEIKVDPNNNYYSSVDGVLFNKQKTELVEYPAGKSGAYIIPDGVVQIRAAAFQGCDKLTSVNIPNGVTDIGNFAFEYCENITDMVIPFGVTRIGWDAFSNCRSLTSVTIPDSVTSIDSHTFENCSKLSTIVLPENVTTIGYCAFYGCSSLSEVIIPDSVTRFDDWVFAECSSLKSIVIPNSATSIGGYSFYGDSNLTSIAIPDNVTSIDAYAFLDCDPEKLTIFCNPGTAAATFAADRGFQTRPLPNWPASESRTYTPDLKLSDLPLTEGFAWATPDTALNVPGGNYKVTYTTADGLHTFTKLVKITVGKVPAPELPVLDPVTYSPTAKLSDIVLPEGWSWKHPDEVLVVPGGEYGINYTPADTVNYADLKTTILLTVNKADPAVTWPVIADVTYKTNLKLSDIALPAGFSWAQPTTALSVPGGSYDMIFTPADTANYNTLTKAIPVKVKKSADSTDTPTSGHGGGSITVTPVEPTPEPQQPDQSKPVPKDIAEVAWAQEYISDVVDRGIMQGYPQDDGTSVFMPNGTATRAEFATALFNYLGFEQDGTTDFADTRDHWARGYISKMVKEGIMTGYDAETFDPDAPVTREQIAVIMYRAFEPKAAAQHTGYTDGDAISDWAEDAVYAVRDAGWMSGDADGAFRPGDTAIRAEIATIFSRLAKAGVKRK